jgi:cystathionine beta-lyase/cystathionine gamma-synthase
VYSLVLNPKAKNYALLKRTWEEDYEDNHWAEDSIFLERNSRDFVSRIYRIGTNAEAICDVLSAHPRGMYLLHASISSHLLLSIYLLPSYLSQSIHLTTHSQTSKLPQDLTNPHFLREMP